MIPVNDYILNSEIATFKNDSQGTVFSLTIPQGTVFNPSSSPTLGTVSHNVGTINSGVRAVGRSSKVSSQSVGNAFATDVSCSRVGFPNTLVTVYCKLIRVSSSTLRMVVTVEQYSGAPNHTTLEPLTVGFTVSTFLQPDN